MPERIEPCLALLSSKAPTGDDWAFEVKWDGYRLGVHIELGRKWPAPIEWSGFNLMHGRLCGHG